MTDWRTLTDKTYLGSYDLPEGKDVIVVIERCEGGTVKGVSGEEKRAPIVHFQGKKKPMILNATNAKCIAKMYGKHIEGWANKPVALFVTQTSAFGEMVDAIRIRPTAPAVPRKGASSDERTLTAVEREPGEETA